LMAGLKIAPLQHEALARNSVYRQSKHSTFVRAHRKAVCPRFRSHDPRVRGLGGHAVKISTADAQVYPGHRGRRESVAIDESAFRSEDAVTFNDCSRNGRIDL
jgi:hypothetical protein